MEQTDNVLLLLTEGGGIMAAEGSLNSVRMILEEDSPFLLLIHPITAQRYILNKLKIVSIQEVTRESIRLGPDKIVKPGGRFN